MKMKIYYKGKKIARKKAEELIGKQCLKQRIEEATQTFLEDPQVIIEWMDSMIIKFEN